MKIERNPKKIKTKPKVFKTPHTHYVARAQSLLSLAPSSHFSKPQSLSNNVIITSIHGVTDPQTPRDRRREVRQLQTQIRNLLPRLHRPPPHRLLPFPPNPHLPNPNLLPPAIHPLRRRLRRPLHRPPDRHRRLRLQLHPHAHAPQGDQGLRHFESHRRSLRKGSDLPYNRRSRD